MSEPLQLLRLTNTTLQKQIADLVEKSIANAIAEMQTSSTSTTDITELTTRLTTLEQKIDRLLNYLENWASIGNLTMRDIKRYV